MGRYVDNDELYFILSGQSKYYEVHFEVNISGKIAHIVYGATPGPHVFNYTTLETMWCGRTEKLEAFMNNITAVEVVKSYTMEQEIRRRMRLMDKLLSEKCNVIIGKRKYSPLAEGKVMIDDDIDNVVSLT